MPLDLVVLIQWIMIYSLDGTIQHLNGYELFCKMTFVVFVLHSFIFFLNKLILDYIQRHVINTIFWYFQELSNPHQRDRLVSVMWVLKNSIGLLAKSMQAYLKNPANLQTKVCLLETYHSLSREKIGTKQAHVSTGSHNIP